MSFELGRVMISREVSAAIEASPSYGREIFHKLSRYTHKDWGDALPEEDKTTNNEAIACGDRLLGAYNTSKGKVWIITEADRSTTTILYPDEY